MAKQSPETHGAVSARPAGAQRTHVQGASPAPASNSASDFVPWQGGQRYRGATQSQRESVQREPLRHNAMGGLQRATPISASAAVKLHGGHCRSSFIRVHIRAAAHVRIKEQLPFSVATTWAEAFRSKLGGLNCSLARRSAPWTRLPALPAGLQVPAVGVRPTALGAPRADQRGEADPATTAPARVLP